MYTRTLNMQNVLVFIHIDSMKIKTATKSKVKGERLRDTGGGE